MTETKIENENESPLTPDPGPPDLREPGMVTLDPQSAARLRAHLRGETLQADELQDLTQKLTHDATVQDDLEALVTDFGMDGGFVAAALVEKIGVLIARRAAEDLRVSRTYGPATIGLSALQQWIDPTRR